MAISYCLHFQPLAKVRKDSRSPARDERYLFKHPLRGCLKKGRRCRLG